MLTVIDEIKEMLTVFQFFSFCFHAIMPQRSNILSLSVVIGLKFEYWSFWWTELWIYSIFYSLLSFFGLFTYIEMFYCILREHEMICFLTWSNLKHSYTLTGFITWLDNSNELNFEFIKTGQMQQINVGPTRANELIIK